MYIGAFFIVMSWNQEASKISQESQSGQPAFYSGIVNNEQIDIGHTDPKSLTVKFGGKVTPAYYGMKNTLSCPVCNVRVKGNDVFREHFSLCHPDHVQCERCYKCLKSDKNPESHVCDPRFVCRECTPSRNLNTANLFKFHQMKLHGREGYSCSLCNKICDTQQSLENHVKKGHQVGQVTVARLATKVDTPEKQSYLDNQYFDKLKQEVISQGGQVTVTRLQPTSTISEKSAQPPTVGTGFSSFLDRLKNEAESRVSQLKMNEIASDIITSQQSSSLVSSTPGIVMPVPAQTIPNSAPERGSRWDIPSTERKRRFDMVPTSEAKRSSLTPPPPDPRALIGSTPKRDNLDEYEPERPLSNDNLQLSQYEAWLLESWARSPQKEPETSNSSKDQVVLSKMNYSEPKITESTRKDVIENTSLQESAQMAWIYDGIHPDQKEHILYDCKDYFVQLDKDKNIDWPDKSSHSAKSNNSSMNTEQKSSIIGQNVGNLAVLAADKQKVKSLISSIGSATENELQQLCDELCLNVKYFAQDPSSAELLRKLLMHYSTPRDAKRHLIAELFDCLTSNNVAESLVNENFCSVIETGFQMLDDEDPERNMIGRVIFDSLDVSVNIRNVPDYELDFVRQVISWAVQRQEFQTHLDFSGGQDRILDLYGHPFGTLLVEELFGQKS